MYVCTDERFPLLRSIPEENERVKPKLSRRRCSYLRRQAETRLREPKGHIVRVDTDIAINIEVEKTTNSCEAH